jgi:hypothetical protein
MNGLWYYVTYWHHVSEQRHYNCAFHMNRTPHGPIGKMTYSEEEKHSFSTLCSCKMKSIKIERNNPSLNQYIVCKSLIYSVDWSREKSLALDGI